MGGSPLFRIALGLVFLGAAGSALAQDHRKAKYHHPHGCAAGTFFDPRKGGECWSCPAGYNRTVFAVDGDKACDKGLFTRAVRATFHRKTGCSAGTFHDLLTGGCWSCPEGFNRSVHPIRSDQACVRAGQPLIKIDVPDFAKEIGGKLTGALQGLGRKAREIRDEALRKLEQFGGDAAKFAGKMADGLKEGFAKVIAWSRAAFEEAKRLASASVAKLAQAAKEAFEKLKKFGKGLLDKIVELATSAVAEILAPLTKKGRLSFLSGPPGSAWAGLRREALPLCDEGFRFMGIPIFQLATSTILNIGTGLLKGVILDKLKLIADDAKELYKAASRNVRWAGDKPAMAAKHAGASFKGMVSKLSAGAVVGGTIGAALVHAASFVTAYPSSYLACLTVLDKWKDETQDHHWGADAAWWESQARVLRPKFAACYENEFVDVFSRDFVWDGFYTLAVTPILDIPILLPLSLQVGALVTAAVTAAVGALTAGTGAFVGPLLGTIAALVVRTGITVAINFILKQTDVYKHWWVKKWYPDYFRPTFKKAQEAAGPWLFEEVYLRGLMGSYRKEQLYEEVKKRLAGSPVGTWRGVEGRLQQISAGSASHVWGVNSANDVFRWSNRGWLHVRGRLGFAWEVKLVNVAVGADGTTWGINSQGHVFRRYDRGMSGLTGWERMPGLLTQISVGSAKNVWGVNKAHDVFRWNGKDWQHISGKLVNVAVGADGEAWGVNAAGNIFRYQGDTKPWAGIPGLLTQVSVGNAKNVWGVNKAHEVFRWNGNNWDLVDGKLIWVAIGQDGAVWGVNKDHHVFQR